MHLSTNKTISSNTYIKFIIWLTLLSTVFIGLTSQTRVNAETQVEPEETPKIMVNKHPKEVNPVFSPYFEEIVPTVKKTQTETKKVVKTKKEEAKKAAQAAELARQQAAAQSSSSNYSNRYNSGPPAEAQNGDWEGRIRYWCNIYGCNAQTLINVMYCESGGRTNATNNAGSGASGLFQHMPRYWDGRAERLGYKGGDTIWDGEIQIHVSVYMWTHGQKSAWDASKNCWG